MALYTTDLLILGSGPAGYTAGIYAARAGLKTMIVSGNQEGGQLTMTSSIENFPGFEEISGFELMDKMKQQALKLGVQFANDNIVEVDFGNRPFVCSSENGHSYKARAVIVATGSSAKWLNIPSEKKYLGYGVSACATCDGFFYRGRTVAVIGGGLGTAIAYPQAKKLHNLGADVTVITGFRNKDLVILEDELKKVSNKLIVATDDGSNGNQGFVTDMLKKEIEAGEKFDEVIAIGPLVMMKFVCKLTEQYNIPTTVSMNPVMIDGTGMCGGCRVIVGGETKFACVDGPDFDGHKIDWDTAMKRGRMFKDYEEKSCKEGHCRIGRTNHQD